MDNETWLLEVTDSIIEKNVRQGIEALSPWGTHVYCLGVADYGMRNAGDLETARDLFADFPSTAAINAKSA